MTRRSVFAFLAIAALVAGCLAPGADVTQEASSPTAPNASAAPETVGRPDSVPGCPNYVTEVETGPPPTDFSENGPIAGEQGRLEGDIEAALAYTEAHRADFGSIRFENAPRVRIVVAFTDHLAEHCAALRDRLDFPDEFEITWAARTEAEMLAIMDEISSTAAETKVLRSVALTSDAIEVRLRADGETFASQLLVQYGDLVRLGVGLFPYPDRVAPDGFSCQFAIEPVAEGTPFRAVVTVGGLEVRSGADFSGSVRVTNMAAGPVTFESGRPATAVVVRPGTHEVVGMYDGGLGGTGIGETLEPGGSIEVNFAGATASCDPALGYALPPGTYEVIVPVDQYAYPVPDAGVVVSHLLSEPVPLTIVP